MRQNNKGIAFAIATTLLVIVVAGVLIIIVVGGLRENFFSLKGIFSKYGPPKIDNSTAFLYSIEGFVINDASKAGCIQDSANPDRFRCPSGKYVDFLVDIKNGGTMMRKIYGGIIVCAAECRRNSCKIVKECKDDFSARGESCFVADGETLECEAGSYQFSAGTYIVYPAATCALQQDIGCYSPTMKEADKIYNPEKSLVITAS